MRFEVFASGQFTPQNCPHLGMVRAFERHVIECEACRRKRIILSCPRRDHGPCCQERKQTA
jgi:hypothetical protein